MSELLCHSLLSNITFRQCRPFSLLLPASNAFFDAQKNLTLLTSIIGGTCATPASEANCDATMSYFVEQLQKPTVCANDIAARNAIVLQAMKGFLNYGFMRDAGCLINQRTNSYCFVDAVASSSPSDFLFYTLALGTRLPNNTVPSCSTCTESLMSIYATQALNKTLGISKTYASAAAQANAVCGAKYAEDVGSASFGFRTSNTGQGLLALSVLLSVVGAVIGVGLVGL